MTIYSKQPFTVVRNEQYSYFKLLVNGVCHFDEFLESIENNSKDMKSMRAILTMMDIICDRVRWRKDKFRQIKDVGRKDVFEFKKDLLRVYVIKQSPNMIIVLGGYKRNQIDDIRRLKVWLKEYESI